MLYRITYSEYMEYEEDIEATSMEDAKAQFEEAIEAGAIEPMEATILEYKVAPVV